MLQATRLTLAALVLCAAFAAPAVAASRQLKQAGGTIKFPGCSFLSDSEIAQNDEFSSLFSALQTSGLNETLANLTSPHTLFAPTNDAFAEFLAAANVTVEDDSDTVYDVLRYHVVPANVQDLLVCQLLLSSASLVAPDRLDFSVGRACHYTANRSVLASLSNLLLCLGFGACCASGTDQLMHVRLQNNMDDITLPTLLENANLTIMTDEVNSTEVITVVSYGSEATVVTPAAYACNVSLLPPKSCLLVRPVLLPACLLSVLSAVHPAAVYLNCTSEIKKLSIGCSGNCLLCT